LIVNPLIDFRTLSVRLTEQLELNPASEATEARTFNAFLLAAGLHQILEDYLHRPSPLLARAAVRFGSFDNRLASVAAFLARGLAAVGSYARLWRRRERRLKRVGEDLTRLLNSTAAAAVGHEAALVQAGGHWRGLRPQVEGFPQPLLETVVRLPNPFATFDQRPDDYRELIRRFVEGWRDFRRPILVLGIRTSGTYLAPLCRALLIDHGYRHVQILTVRAGQRWRRDEVAILRSVTHAGGLVMIVDDPPRTGSAVARVAEECIDRGVPADAIVLILQLLGERESLPHVLRGYASVLLPRDEWAIENDLSPASVRGALTRMLVGREISSPHGTVRVATVGEVDRVALRSMERRGRAQALYRTGLIGSAGERVEHHVYVRGTGRGYFADYPRAVATRLRDYLPEIYGIESGLLYREWLPSTWRLREIGGSGLERRIASYVRTRQQALAVDRAIAARATDQYASWDLVADILGWALLDKLRMLVAPLTWAAARRLTANAQPSLVDGRMSASNWFVPPDSSPAESAVKIEPDERTFASAARLTYDPIFDLASAGASFDVEELLCGASVDHVFSERLLEAFTALTNEEIDGERWFLYQVMNNRSELKRLFGVLTGDSDRVPHTRRLLATERALAAAEQRYISDVFLGDLHPPRHGPLCALDVDWVLETRWLDFPVLLPSAALALRALIRHGFRPVLATGRPLGELRSRARMYRLAGGVAEYGSVLYNHLAGQVSSHVTSRDEAALTRLREVLRSTGGVYLDDAYRYGVRAIRLIDGRRRSLNSETIATALAEAGAEESVQVLYGHLQTDFASASVDKGSGLRALARQLGEKEDVEPFEFAIGDDEPDIPMLELARSRFAPANASPALRNQLGALPGIKVVRQPRGAGLLEAVKSFLGHDPRRCAICAPPRLSARTRLVIIPLTAAESNRRGRLLQIAAMGALLLRS
jgi:hydroxymethylpyrimidine pyrophosphatase-like HAD family hydrolase